MITIEISDESILFLIKFLVFSIIVGLLVVECDFRRMKKKRKKKEIEQ